MYSLNAASYHPGSGAVDSPWSPPDEIQPVKKTDYAPLLKSPTGAEVVDVSGGPGAVAWIILARRAAFRGSILMDQIGSMTKEHITVGVGSAIAHHRGQIANEIGGIDRWVGIVPLL